MKKNNRINFKKYLLTAIALSAFCLLFFGLAGLNNSLNISKPSKAANSPDAIAIRVIPNPEHMSALRWYSSQGFDGAPQSLIVDGYEAIRDGRTVYVDAANVSGGKLYTNIYLISYNQEAEIATLDIFSQILSHWKFNTNITTTGVCTENGSIRCLSDADCASFGYCSSPKATITRDTIRLSRLAEVNWALYDYYNKFGRFPVLGSGSYLPHRTISVWPSWQETLARELGIHLPIDPLNKLGYCDTEQYDEVTCWDDVSKSFAGDVTPDTIELPSGSYAFVYSTDSKGTSYNICAVMESGLLDAGEGACSSSESVDFGGEAENHDPLISCGTMSGVPGAEFVGFVSAYDQDNDSLNWSISGVGWLDLQDGPVPNQKKLYSSSAGGEGVYSVTVLVSDGRGGNASRDCEIRISSGIPAVSPITDKIIISGEVLNFNIIAYDPTDLAITNFTISNLTSPGDSLSCSEIGPEPGEGYYCHVDQTIEFATGEYLISVEARASDNDTSPATQFRLRVINNPPVIQSFSCPTPTRMNRGYEGCTVTAVDPDGHNIDRYDLIPSSHPAGLNINPTTGIISGSPSESGMFTVEVVARDQYGAVSEPVSFLLKVNSFCGDGSKQTQNDEYRGGPGNNGREDCDNTSGVAAIPADSSYGKQYECTTPPECGETGFCPGTCQYTGGWCGDGIVQSTHGEQCDGIAGLGEHQVCSSVCTLIFLNYCGDGTKQTPNQEGKGGPLNDGQEQCDGTSGVADNPGASSATKQYECTTPPICLSTVDCTGLCEYTGGYCGDGIVQTAYNEQCDTIITDSKEMCEILKNNGLHDLDEGELNCDDLSLNLRTEAELINLYVEICQDCHIECIGDIRFSLLGAGCYMDNNHNGKIDAGECDKGIYKCTSGDVVCEQDPAWAGVARDYCCEGNSAGLATQAVDVVDITLKGNGTAGNPYVYRTCDEICRDWGRAQSKEMICIGVGMNDGAGVHNECVGPVHDMGGGNCSLAGNQVAVNCKNLIFYDSWGCHPSYNYCYGDYTGNKYGSYATCEADSVKPEYHDIGYKPEFGPWDAIINTGPAGSGLGALYTKRPCIFMPAGMSIPGLSSLPVPNDMWYRAFYNKTSGNSFCYEGTKYYNKYTTSCYCQEMP